MHRGWKDRGELLKTVCLPSIFAKIWGHCSPIGESVSSFTLTMGESGGERTGGGMEMRRRTATRTLLGHCHVLVLVGGEWTTEIKLRSHRLSTDAVQVNEEKNGRCAMLSEKG